MTEFASESAVVIAANGDDLRTFSELGESFFDVGTLRFAWAWGVDEIANEDDSLRR